MTRPDVKTSTTFVAVSILSLVFLLPLVAKAPATSAPAGVSGEADGVRRSGQLRSMPLLSANGAVRKAFPSGDGLDDAETVRSAAQSIADDIGIGEAFAQAWSVLPEVGDRTFTERAAEPTWPYDYPWFDQLEGAVTPEVTKQHPDDLVQLAGLLVLAEASGEKFSTTAVPVGAAEIGDVLTRALAASGDCDAALTSAWIAGLGQSPIPETVDRAFGRAVKACPDDPTPRWLWGQVSIDISVSPVDEVHGQSREQALKRPIDFFNKWIEDDPSSALAKVGLGDALVVQAEGLRNTRVAPFTVRSYAERASALYESAGDLDANLVVDLSKARVAELLGDVPATRELAARAAGSATDNARVTAHAADLLLHAGNVKQAAAVVDAYGGDSNSFTLARGEYYDRRVSLPADSDRSGMVLDATIGAYGAGEVDWLGFIPDYRSRFEQARASASVDTISHRVQLVADHAMNDVASDEPLDADSLQDLYRYAGDRERATEVAQKWFDDTGDPKARQRLGELAFLGGSFEKADRIFGDLLDEVSTDEGSDWTSANAAEVSLMRGLVLEKLDRLADAADSYETAEQTEGTTSVAAMSRRAKVLSDEGHGKEALDEYAQAAASAADVEESQLLQDLDVPDLFNPSYPPSSGTEYNNYAVALLDSDGDAEIAVEHARWALARDPESPVFRDTLAQSLDKAGLVAEAEKEYETVTKADASVYQTQNNLGVIAASRGDWVAARRAFKAAVAAKGDYPLGWFNYGVALTHSPNPASVLQSQGAMAKAVRLDSSYRGEQQTVRSDVSAVNTGLDVSRPVSVGWTFGSAATTPAPGLGWMIILVASVRLLLSLGADRLVEGIGVRLLDRRQHSGQRWSRVWLRLNRLVPVSLAVAATALIGSWAFLGSEAVGWWSGLLVLAVVGSLVWLFVVVSTGKTPARRHGWVPLIGFGAVTAVLGVTLIPVPVEGDEATPLRARWRGVLLLCSVAAMALVVAWATGVPLVRIVGVAALAMASAALLPFKPLDGGFISSRLPITLISGGLLVAAIGLTAGWI